MFRSSVSPRKRLDGEPFRDAEEIAQSLCVVCVGPDLGPSTFGARILDKCQRHYQAETLPIYTLVGFLGPRE